MSASHYSVSDFFVSVAPIYNQMMVLEVKKYDDLNRYFFPHLYTQKRYYGEDQTIS